MSVAILTEHHFEFLSLKGGCTGSSESTLVKMPHCWKSHVVAQLYICTYFFTYPFILQYAIKHLRSSKGNIINMSSMAGVHGQGKAMAYSVSKVFEP